MAQATGGAALFLENRFFGESSPYQELTADKLQYLTVNQTIRDMVNFAQNVQLPFDTNRTSTPDKAPWILTGCSYSGSLTAWTETLAPGVFWAYHASSAVIEARDELWQMYEVDTKAMPKNCSTDVALAIDAIDKVLATHDQKAKHALKARFGLGVVEYDDDFAETLKAGPSTWASTMPSTGYHGSLFQFCDYIENQWPGSNETQPNAHGVGAEKALTGYAKWFMDVYMTKDCLENLDCWDTHNTTDSLYTDLSVGNSFRQWMWMVCNEPFKWFLSRGRSKIVSRFRPRDYEAQMCARMFPAGSYGISRGLDAESLNRITGGWNKVNTTRLSWTVGELASWFGGMMEAWDRPGGPLPDTPEHPVFVIPGAFHCANLMARDRDVNEGVRKAWDAQLVLTKQWVKEFYEEKTKRY